MTASNERDGKEGKPIPSIDYFGLDIRGVENEEFRTMHDVKSVLCYAMTAIPSGVHRSDFELFMCRSYLQPWY